MRDNNPGGGVGLIVLLVIFVVGLVFNIEWMRSVGLSCLALWIFMLVFGFLLGAKR